MDYLTALVRVGIGVKGAGGRRTERTDLALPTGALAHRTRVPVHVYVVYFILCFTHYSSLSHSLPLSFILLFVLCLSHLSTFYNSRLSATTGNDP